MMFTRLAVRVLERDSVKGESTVLFLTSGKTAIVPTVGLYEHSEPGQPRVAIPVPEMPRRAEPRRIIRAHLSPSDLGVVHIYPRRAV